MTKENEGTKLKTTPNKSNVEGGVRPPCCYNCKHLGYTPPQHDQPYSELWCKEGEWGGAANKDELLAENDCELYKRVD